MDKIILSKEQEKAVSYNQANAFAIKGIAGSGKTTVGLHRISFLSKKCLDNEKIMVVTFHKILVNYLEYLSHKDTSQNAEIEFTKNTFDKYNFVSIDSLIYKKYLQFKNNNKEHRHYQNLPRTISRDKELDALFDKALHAVKVTYPNLLSNDKKDFLKEEVNYINNCGINSLKEYQIFTRSGRNRTTESRTKLQKKSEFREAIFQLRRKYNNLLISSGLMDFPVMRLLALKQVSEYSPQQYKHIIIDECQDMDHTQFDFLKHFLDPKPGSSATFLYDNTQSIYKSSWLGNGHSFNSLGIDIKGRSKILKHNFRTTYEIQEAAQSLIVGNEYITQEIEPVLINRSGTKPFWANCNSFDHQVDYIFDVIKTHAENFKLSDIIVTARTWKQVSALNSVLQQRGINCGILKAGDESLNKDQVRIMTVHSSKGLESEVVIMADLNEDVFPWKVKGTSDIVRDIKLMYVGMTRASKHLYLTSYGKPSVFFDSIDHNTLKIIDFNNFESFQPISDQVIKSKMSGLIDRIMEVMVALPNLTSGAESRTDFKDKVNITIQKQHQLVIIHQELIDLKEKVPANTTTHDLYQNLWEQSEKQADKVMNTLFNFINAPVDFKECFDDIKAEYYNFCQNSIQAITTVEYEIKKMEITNDKSEKDWGAYLTTYSKAIEFELKNIIRKNKLETKEKKTGALTLFEMLAIFEEKGMPFSLIGEKLNHVNFRKKRNEGTHYKIMSHDELMPIQQELMKKNGVFDNINEILEN